MLTALSASAAAGETADRPNVIVIVSDDHGSRDAGCYGTRDVETPHLDALAASGIRFDQFYGAAPVCSPSRAGVLTGRAPLRCGVPTNAASQHDQPGGLPASEVTLAAMFKAAGYATANIGKWHLGYTRETMPNAHGFDTQFGHMGGCIDSWSQFFYWSGPNVHDLYRNGKEIYASGRFFSDMMVEEADRFLAAHRDRPFFLYFTPNMPHYPYQPDTRWLKRMSHLSYPRNLYAAFLGMMDERIGKLIQRVESLNLRNRTIVIYQSDHGHSTEERAHFGGGSAGPFRGAKFSHYEGGIRVPAILSWPGTVPAGQARGQMAWGCDWLPTLAELCRVAPPGRPLDGKSLAAVLRSAEAPSPHDALVWPGDRSAAPSWAVREGDWKLLGRPLDTSVTAAVRPEEGVRLYNLAEDIGERSDLAAAHTDIVARLQRRYEHSRAACERDTPG
ncbi:MAG TPA: sulfatase-like hydrolase/transferase [Chthonomonadaceae bacterium]|nr:sulfatase-like hydrolase/transferase [Chthonomonadaceae bacterium]